MDKELKRIDTGKHDNNLSPIYVGDKMRIPRHLDSHCCEHYTICTIKWNEEWKAYGLQADDNGEWLSGMGMVIEFTIL